MTATTLRLSANFHRFATTDWTNTSIGFLFFSPFSFDGVWLNT
jgi:hypothetical protein